MSLFFGVSLIKLEFTLGFISKDSGGTSNKIWVLKNADSFSIYKKETTAKSKIRSDKL